MRDGGAGRENVIVAKGAREVGATGKRSQMVEAEAVGMAEVAGTGGGKVEAAVETGEMAVAAAARNPMRKHGQ
jgi:hypothetical protein